MQWFKDLGVWRTEPSLSSPSVFWVIICLHLFEDTYGWVWCVDKYFVAAAYDWQLMADCFYCMHDIERYWCMHVQCSHKYALLSTTIDDRLRRTSSSITQNRPAALSSSCPFSVPRRRNSSRGTAVADRCSCQSVIFLRKQVPLFIVLWMSPSYSLVKTYWIQWHIGRSMAEALKTFAIITFRSVGLLIAQLQVKINKSGHVHKPYRLKQTAIF